MERLTIKEAIAQGYTLYGDGESEFYKLLNELDENEFQDFDKRGGVFYLTEKFPIPLEVGDASEHFESMMDGTNLSEGGWESCEDFLEQFKIELQALLDKIKAESVKQRATRTYNLTQITLKPEEE